MKIIVFLVLIAIAFSQSWIVGSASNSVLPTVNGKVDYIREVPESDHEGPGTFVPKFDQGPMKVGNGGFPATWVRDDINVTVVTLRVSSGQTLVIISANVYMIFKNDWEIYYDKVRKAVGNRFGELKFISHADHNHHGPDTSGTDPFVALNEKWYAHMLDVMGNTTLQAFASEQRCVLDYSEREWAYGMVKNRDPRILDKGLRIIQAKSADRTQVLATIVQWTNHPEVTLGMVPTVPREDCERLGIPNCSAQDKYFTSDFVGVMQRQLKRKYGSNVLYLNGAVGLLIAPLRAEVWEITEKCPLRGDGEIMPDGCQALPKNFRKTFLIGRELGNAIENTARNGKELPAREFRFKTQEFFTRVTNIKFRIGAAALKTRNRGLIGYSSRDVYECTNHTNPSPSTCKDDGYQNTPTVVPFVPMRKGDYFKSITNLVDFGPVKWLTAPAEVPPELFVGLPDDFLTNTGKYYKNPNSHAYGADYKIPGYAKKILGCTKDHSCWFIGLGGDELGYSPIIADIRIRCLYTDRACDRLPLTIKDARSMSGVECRWVTEHEEDARKKYGVHFRDIQFTCNYGLISQASNHYEETNGLGYNLASDWIRSVEDIMK